MLFLSFSYSPASQMCKTIVSADIKYLRCGHVSNKNQSDEDCGSTHCLNSQMHGQWDQFAQQLICNYGQQPNCIRCAQGHGACRDHHSCRQRHSFDERYNHIANQYCNRCQRRRWYVFPFMTSTVAHGAVSHKIHYFEIHNIRHILICY